MAHFSVFNHDEGEMHLLTRMNKKKREKYFYLLSMSNVKGTTNYLASTIAAPLRLFTPMEVQSLSFVANPSFHHPYKPLSSSRIFNLAYYAMTSKDRRRTRRGTMLFGCHSVIVQPCLGDFEVATVRWASAQTIKSCITSRWRVAIKVKSWLEYWEKKRDMRDKHKKDTVNQ